jgi:4,5-dihydroxyphthalate decarboxylase
LNYLPLQAEEIFGVWDTIEFDAGNVALNAATWIARGSCPFVPIPVFPSRYFRHSCVFINEGSGIRRPEDLKVKGGYTGYSITAAVWIRGFLQDDYGIEPRTSAGCRWPGEAGRKERVELRLPRNQSQQHRAGKTLNGMLESGDSML